MVYTSSLTPCVDAVTAWFKYSHVYLMYIWRIKSSTPYQHVAYFHARQEMLIKFKMIWNTRLFLHTLTHHSFYGKPFRHGKDRGHELRLKLKGATFKKHFHFFFNFGLKCAQSELYTWLPSCILILFFF